MTVEIENDGKEKYQSFTARWKTEVIGGMGTRNVELTGWGAAELESRQQLVSQARAARDELNLAIETMIDGLITEQQVDNE